MERQKRFIINCLYFGIILAAVYLLVKFAFPVLAPFLIGFLIAYILRRPIRFLSERFHIPKKLTAIGLVAVFYVTIGSVLVLGSIQIFSSAASLVESLPALFRDYVIPVLTELFDTGEFQRLYLNFSDPWPKKRMYKRRLTYREYLQSYREAFGEKGEIFFKTDNRNLFEFSLNEFCADNWKLSNISLDLHNSDFEGNIMTEYEEKFSSQGMPIYRLEARYGMEDEKK